MTFAGPVRGRNPVNPITRLLLASALLAGGAARADDDPPQQSEQDYQKQQEKLRAELGKKATHEQTAEIKVKGETTGTALQTLCIDTSGRVLGLVAPPRGYGAAVKGGTAEVHVFSPDGKPVTTWKIPFHAHSINAGPDGTVYVAGDAKVARFDRDGKSLGDPVELPHIADLLKDEKALRAKAEVALKREKEQMAESLKEAKKEFAERVKKLEEKPEADRTKTEKRQLTQYKAILKSYEENEGFYAKRTVEDVLGGMVGRLRVVNGIAVSETDVFVATGEADGYGYGVWRLDRELKDVKKILSDIGGCCGQMDVQVQGKELLVAENTRHQFARYDRDGKKVGSYGKRGEDTNPACFGGCCNPMNVRAAAAGEVLTSESEGVVKRFSPKGEFLGVVGTVPVGGGCKNVAVGASADLSKVYFCDQPGSRFFILSKKATAAATGADGGNGK